MSHRTPPPERLPTLTEVVEYDGEAMRVRALTRVERQDCVTEPPALPVPAMAGLEAAAGAAPSAAPAARRGDDLLERRLRMALEPLFEQMLQRAISEVRGGLAESAGAPAGSDIVPAEAESTRQRPAALNGSDDTSP